MDAILTDEDGRPLPRPSREDYPDVFTWMRAIFAYNDRVTGIANKAFLKAFAASLKP